MGNRACGASLGPRRDAVRDSRRAMSSRSKSDLQGLPGRQAEGRGSAAEPTDILQRLLKLHNRLMGPFATHLEKQHRITVNGFRVLMLIGRLGVSASHELAEILGVNAMSVHRAVNALHLQGRIVIEPDPADSRRKILRLTPEGQRLFRQMLPVTDVVANYLLSSLKPRDIEVFDRLVTALIQGLEARDEEGRSIFLERTRPADTPQS
jgi:DNA-binding MarR family transcriptional regulator